MREKWQIIYDSDFRIRDIHQELDTPNSLNLTQKLEIAKSRMGEKEILTHLDQCFHDIFCEPSSSFEELVEKFQSDEDIAMVDRFLQSLYSHNYPQKSQSIFVYLVEDTEFKRQVKIILERMAGTIGKITQEKVKKHYPHVRRMPSLPEAVISGEGILIERSGSSFQYNEGLFTIPYKSQAIISAISRANYAEMTVN